MGGTYINTAFYSLPTYNRKGKAFSSVIDENLVSGFIFFIAVELNKAIIFG